MTSKDKDLDLQKAIELVTASWVLAFGRAEAIPVGRRGFPHALKLTIDQGAFAPALAGLRFVETGGVTRSRQLDNAVLLGHGLLFGSPNPAYAEVIPLISVEAATTILDDFGIDPKLAVQWAELLKKNLSEFNAA